MQNRQQHLVLLFWLLAGVQGMIPVPCLSADYAVHTVDPAVTNHMILRDGPLPPVCREATTMTVSACRGEYEPASFVVTAAKPLSQVRIELSPVTGPGGKWPDDAIDVRVVKDYYSGTLAGGAAAQPMLLVHDESFLAIEPIPNTDPERMTNVATGPLRDTAELKPVNVPQRKQFWITVHVPVDAVPGSYSTTVRIIPRNADVSELTLNIEVYPFDLLAPMKKYCIYYPIYISRNLPPENQYSFADRTEQQYLADLRNMLAHGLTNPNICEGPVIAGDGTLDFTPLAKVLDLRESVGMRPRVLYLSNMSSGIGHPLLFTLDRPLTPEERQQIQKHVREINAWVRARGYDEAYFMAVDEQWGEKLAQERDTMTAIKDAGGKVFVAVISTDYFDSVGDVLQRPILFSPIGAAIEATVTSLHYEPAESLRHMDEIGKAGSFTRLNSAGFRTVVDSVHRLGNKIFTYMNPMGGVQLPELQRRNEGLGLWRTGLDGTMTWAYMNLKGERVNQPMQYAKVFRTDDGVLDTLHWEGFREGVDDVRYLTTLMTTLNDCIGRFPNDELVLQTYAWLHTVDIATGDLDAIRREMADRIIALLDLGLGGAPEKILAGIDLATVQVRTFPETWRFKYDREDKGISAKWFAPTLDSTQWAPIRTNKQLGWENQGFPGGPGLGWYRAALPVDQKAVAGKFTYLYFEAVDEEAWVYLNGREVFEHTVTSTDLLPEQIWTTPFSVPLIETDLQGADLLAVRVYSKEAMAGIWKPVHLIISHQQLTSQQARAVIQLKTKKE